MLNRQYYVNDITHVSIYIRETVIGYDITNVSIYSREGVIGYVK
jgi:hypothetical protein